jgi:hypothetical protein
MVLKLGHLGHGNRYKYTERSVMWCWRRMEWRRSVGHRVRNEVLHGIKEDRNILNTTKRRQANWIGHILRRNCLLNTFLKEM